MPKRRGKSAARHPPLPSPIPGPMDRFLGSQRAASQIGSGPLAGAAEVEEFLASSGLDVTLSPEERAPPPQPPIMSSPLLGELGPTLERAETAMALGSLLQPEGAGGPKSEGVAEHLDVTRDQQGREQEIKFPSQFTTKPKEVTLDSLWELISQLGKLFFLQTTTENQKITQLELKVEQNKSDLQKVVTRMEKMDQEVKKIETLQTILVKDISSLRAKAENFENYMRNHNLRFVNFPKVLMVQPGEMLKRYLQEVLEIPQANLPPFTKVYYLPSKLPDQNLQQEQRPENLSQFLETSDIELATAATLVATVALLPDKQWLFSMFFKHREKPFLGLKVSLFPDISRETQRKRKQFLLLNTAVKQLGGVFFLRYPCKCIVRLGSLKYVFLEPSQLSVFVSSKRISGGSDINGVALA